MLTTETRSLYQPPIENRPSGLQTCDGRRPNPSGPVHCDTDEGERRGGTRLPWAEEPFDGVSAATTRSPRRSFTRVLTLALAFALVAPWGFAQTCPHQGRAPVPTEVAPTNGPIVNCSNGQEMSVVGVGTASSSSSSCPRFMTTGITFNNAVAAWNKRVVDSTNLENIRREFTCNTRSYVWGLYSSTSCDQTSSSVIQVENHVLSDAYCPVLSPPLVQYPEPKGDEPTEGPVMPGPPQPTPDGN